MSWITYTVTAESGTIFTHFTKLKNLTEAQAEWEQEFNQKAKSIVLDDDTEVDFSELFEVVPELEPHISAFVEDRAWYEECLAEVQKMNEEAEA